MKFLVSKNIHSNPNFKLLLSFYSFLLLFYFLGDLFYLGHFFGTSTEAVFNTLRGNAEEFIEPLSLLSLLEHIHVSLFLGIMALFTTLAIVLRLRLHALHTRVIIALSMGSFLLSVLSLMLGYFIHESFIYIFYYGTVLWHGVGIYGLFHIIIELGFNYEK